MAQIRQIFNLTQPVWLLTCRRWPSPTGCVHLYVNYKGGSTFLEFSSRKTCTEQKLAAARPLDL